MTLTRSPHARRQRTGLPLAVIFIVILLAALAPLQALAQEGSEPIGPYVVTLEAGESLEIPVHGFCLNYGLPFPNDVLDPIEVASDPLRNAAVYSLQTGYVDSNAYDVQKAIWNLSDGTRIENEDYALADEIIEYANSGVQPADVVEGVPHMASLVVSGTLDAKVEDFVNVAPELGAFFGGGTLVISNTAEAPQQFVVSYGTVGNDAAEGDQQDMLVFPSQPAPEVPDRAVTEVTEVPKTGGFLPPVVYGVLALLGASTMAYTAGRIRRTKSAP